jgi:outer membrane biosynthesis protein TonB
VYHAFQRSPASYSPRAGEHDYYEPMRACATANAIFLGLALGALTFAACSSGQTPPPSPAGSDPIAPPSPSSEPDPATGAPAATAAARAAQPQGPPQSDITNEPDGGVVLNNAMTAGDAGASDRFQPLVDLFKANRDGFRRCFDLWGQKNRGQSGTVYLVIHLKTDGKLDKAEVDPSKGNLHAAEVETCMIDFAKSLTYPKSPSGKETRFTYPFDFKAK